MTSRSQSPRRFGSLWRRLTRGTRWTWLDPRYAKALPADLEEQVMGLDARDRLHAKQGRSTARVVFHGPDGPVSVYLKRHFRLPWAERLAALVHPAGHHTPGAAEFAHLDRARALGLTVPDVVAAGERLGPWGHVQSFLMVAELTGALALHEAIPVLAETLEPRRFERLKRVLARRMAEATARLHVARAFHKDLYLCHFYVNMTEAQQPDSEPGITVIDLHRLGVHRWLSARWRWKDLGQLLYSTEGVNGLSRRDALRFFAHYRRLTHLRWPRWQARMIVLKAERYLRHNTS